VAMYVAITQTLAEAGWVPPLKQAPKAKLVKTAKPAPETVPAETATEAAVKTADAA
jgi:hypothetical protein